MAQEKGAPIEFAPPENLAGKGEVPRRKLGKTGEVVSAIDIPEVEGRAAAAPGRA